jgi:hypothetical protein
MSKTYTKFDAAYSLYKAGGTYVKITDIHDTGEVAIVWKDEHTTTTAEENAITAEKTRLQSVYDNAEYQRTRAAAYAEVKEQLDLLYHDMAADKGDKTGEWFKACKAVKDATAKPE